MTRNEIIRYAIALVIMVALTVTVTWLIKSHVSVTIELPPASAKP